MIQIFGTTFAALLGLAFGSFLNVCLSRWPEGESVVHPRSHCRNCTHTLAWWENLPLVSWLALRGRCRNCQTNISWRYPLVELLVGALWAVAAWQIPYRYFFEADLALNNFYYYMAVAVGWMIFYWLMVALAFLDAENLWLPDKLTLPGIVLGLLFTLFKNGLAPTQNTDVSLPLWRLALTSVLSILVAAALILLIRWLYQIIRHQEGLGLGDAKLMALLAAWLGLPCALLSFGMGILLGSAVALVLLLAPKSATNHAAPQSEQTTWALTKLPLGTFLCIGGIISSMAGEKILTAYLRWAGF